MFKITEALLKRRGGHRALIRKRSKPSRKKTARSKQSVKGPHSLPMSRQRVKNEQLDVQDFEAFSRGAGRSLLITEGRPTGGELVAVDGSNEEDDDEALLYREVVHQIMYGSRMEVGEKELQRYNALLEGGEEELLRRVAADNDLTANGIAGRIGSGIASDVVPVLQEQSRRKIERGTQKFLQASGVGAGAEAEAGAGAGSEAGAEKVS